MGREVADALSLPFFSDFWTASPAKDFSFTFGMSISIPAFMAWGQGGLRQQSKTKWWRYVLFQKGMAGLNSFYSAEIKSINHLNECEVVSRQSHERWLQFCEVKKVFHSFSFLLHIYKRIMDSTWVILRKFMKITTFFGFRWLTPNNNQTNIIILSYPYEQVVGFHGGLQEGHQVLWSHRLYVANVPCPWRPAGGFVEEVGCPFGFIRNPWVFWCLFQKTLDIKCLQYIYI